MAILLSPSSWFEHTKFTVEAFEPCSWRGDNTGKISKSFGCGVLSFLHSVCFRSLLSGVTADLIAADEVKTYPDFGLTEFVEESESAVRIRI